MKTLIRDDTEHGKEYVLKSDAMREIERLTAENAVVQARYEHAAEQIRLSDERVGTLTAERDSLKEGLDGWHARCLDMEVECEEDAERMFLLLKQNEELAAERDAALAASRHETDMCQQALEDLEKLTAERDSLCASCVQETKYNNAARGEIRKLTGESAVLRGLLKPVLRGLLKQALGVLETITDDDMETDDRVMLSAIKNDIVRGITPQAESGELL